MSDETKRKMLTALRGYITAAQALSLAWDQEALDQTDPYAYPACLPSFDEHVDNMVAMYEALGGYDSMLPGPQRSEGAKPATSHPPHFVTHENAGNDPATHRPYSFAVQAVSPRDENLDTCDVQVTGAQFGALRAHGLLHSDARYPADGWVRGTDLSWIDTGDLSPGGVAIDIDGSDPHADFVLARYRQPSESEINAYLTHSCEAANHSEDECDLACPWCGRVHGFDGYCDDVYCPNYKGAMVVDRHPSADDT